MNEKAFDDEIKNKIKNYKPQLPNIVLNRIDETLLSLSDIDAINSKNDKKHKFTFDVKIKKQVVAAALTIAVLFGIAIPSYAKGITVLSSVLKYFNIGNGYANVVTKFGVYKESNGVKVTVDSTIYDGYQLLVPYTVESAKSLKEKPIVNVNGLIKTDSKNKSIASFSNEYGEFKDTSNKLYSGAVCYRVAGDNFNFDEKSNGINKTVIEGRQIDSSKIPNKYTLSLSIDKLGEVQGKWSFDLSIESEKAKGNIKQVTVNKDLSNLFPNTKLGEIIVTPIRVYLQGTVSSSNVLFNYIVLNDKKEVLKEVSGGEVVQYKNYGRYIGAFNDVGKTTSTITLIPYNYYQQGRKGNTSIPLNLKGTTKVPVGSNKELTITRVSESGGKTYIYYESQYPIFEFLPFSLVDNNGKTYMRNASESVSGANGRESVLVFDELLLSKNINIINDTIVYYDQAFTIDIK